MPSEYISVRILDTAYQADKAYTYFVPQEMRAQVGVGITVSVPFGKSNRHTVGMVTGFVEKPDYDGIKPVVAVVRDGLKLTDEFVRICLFMHKRYFCSFGAAVKAILPPGYDVRSAIYYTPATNCPGDARPECDYILQRIATKRKMYEQEITDEFGKEVIDVLDTLVHDGYLMRGSEQAKKPSEKYITRVMLNVSEQEALDLLDSRDGLTEKQKELVILLMHYDNISLAEVEEIGGLSAAIVAALCKKGIVKKERERIERKPYSDEPLPVLTERTPNEEQSKAIDTLSEMLQSDEPSAALLYGVTGSGKTLVITETVKNVVSGGRTAIIMLPEIALTSQAMLTYKAAFGDDLAIIHSKLSAGERIDAYRAIGDGRIKVVLGTRSAVFAPLKNLGLIVMDEEQEGSYKSELSPKYHARDIARLRAGINKCLLLLASATPSIESYYKAISGSYKLIKLTKRVGDIPLPDVIIEDIRDDKTMLPDKLIGQRLKDEIASRTAKGQQAILFAGRRGYNSQVICRTCGEVATCPNCSVALTYHVYMGENIKHRRLVCHYCGYSEALTDTCKACGGKHLGFFGFGTQKLQEEIEERLPSLTAIRMDSDTTTFRYSHDKLLGEFREGKADILFGTQMICKGLDFPKVSLAAVVSVDNLLYMNDFRASERTFSLLTQLIGRAGRAGEGGLAVLQTMNPEHETLRLAATQDYQTFAEGEIAFRRASVFPPFCSIAVFTASADTAEALESYTDGFPSLLYRYKIDESIAKIRVFGPYPEGVFKIGGRYRQKVIIKYSDNEDARNYLATVYRYALSHLPQSVRLELDINPNVV